MSVGPGGDRVERVVVSLGAEELLALEKLLGADADAGEAETIAAAAFRQGLAAMLAAAAPAASATGGAESTHPAAAAQARESTLARLLRRRRVRLFLSALSAAALAVLLVGGYDGGWSWTGFSGNNQLWDWLHLLLLPIAFGTFPLWLKYGGYMSQPRKLMLVAFVAAFAAFVAAGYMVPLAWTGFPGNTLWDWLTLLVLPITLMTVRMWPSTGRELRPAHIALATLLGVGWVVTLIGGYADNWAWTGYPGNTLWDWLSLLLGPVVITSILIPATVRWLSGDVERIAAQEEKQREQARRRPPAAAPRNDARARSGGSDAARR